MYPLKTQWSDVEDGGLLFLCHFCVILYLIFGVLYAILLKNEEKDL